MPSLATSPRARGALSAVAERTRTGRMSDSRRLARRGRSSCDITSANLTNIVKNGKEIKNTALKLKENEYCSEEILTHIQPGTCAVFRQASRCFSGRRNIRQVAFDLLQLGGQACIYW
ncbi:hypothetical protein CDAR_77111 [Caerostris darwini]|uniref:Ribosomal protein S14 n=1 Tax=Caerostris darwini TaxID=1538125 RepID=A0AAV4U9E4_9ARAC|nr:hypothetical protein CDAR_77111 [Caerostris darwini]